METEEKRGGREGVKEAGGFGLGFGVHPQKLMRTAAFPFRAAAAGLYYGELERSVQCLPGGGAASVLRWFPFTSAQWQELQRQALIYKHFTASVPVPPDLLLPSSARCFPEAPTHLFAANPEMVMGGGTGCYKFTGTADPEPGRCRRTDGKKWRCSRDVAPGMKYCERHVHRGRPRSRKPVEALHKPKPTATAAAASTAQSTVPPAATASTPVLKLPFQSMEPPKDTRYVDVNREWELMHLKMGPRSEPVSDLPHYEDQFNLNYTDLNEQCYSFLNTELSSLEQEAATTEHRDLPRSYIDAWSNENTNGYKSTSTAGKLPLSTLTLSMSGNEEDTDQIQMGLGLSDGTGSMAPFGGGPLAEVLQSNNVTSPHNGCSSGSSKSSCAGLINTMGKGCGGSHEASPQESPTRPASSPTGVLQKALVSLSDSSSSGSPTFAASRAELALQWLNQSK